MADLKISQLSSATALAGTEVVPVVQGGSTKKATIDQILAPASGKGINFAAAGGDTLSMYDEGTFTLTTAGDATGVIGSQTAQYTRIGNTVFVRIVFTVTTNFTGNRLGGLPFTVAGSTSISSVYAGANVINEGSASLICSPASGTTEIAFYTDNQSFNTGGLTTTNSVFRASFSYFV